LSFANDLRRVRSRSARFEKVLEERARVLVVSHNNPDPDSIVSALLLETLLTRVFGISVTTAYSGVIGRAENKALLEYCGVQPVPLLEIDVSEFETVALVDTQPGTGNHPFEEARKVAIVLDHHRLRPDTRQVAFFDVREHLGSTTTLLYLYWWVWKLELTPKFATAMLYALRSETADMGRAASVVDRRLFKDLYALADLRALSRIVNAKVGEGYFSAIHKAIDRAVVYGPLVIIRMGKLPYPDAVAQIADYFLKYEKVSTAFSIGVYGNEILFSLRSDDPGALLGSLARRIAGGLGTAGGHESGAGGQIPVARSARGGKKSLQEAVIARLLEELGLKGERPRNLIQRIPDSGGS
jgi:nanoRNase/pAp phosphatase (c-di-AMP/oligoRNAs hydrolase)